MEKKFTTLRIIAGLFKVLAWIVAVLTVISFMVLLVGGTAMSSIMESYREYSGMGTFGILSGVALAFVTLIYGALTFVSLLAAGELIMVILTIEENTRALKPPQIGG